MRSHIWGCYLFCTFPYSVEYIVDIKGVSPPQNPGTEEGGRDHVIATINDIPRSRSTDKG